MKSEFQFSNPALLNIVFLLNQGFEPEKDKPVKIDVETETKIGPGEDEHSSFVVLKVTIGKKDNSVPFYVCAEEGAMFKWEKDTVYGVNPENLLNQNAPALLLSYLRPTIALITNASPFSAYDIPFMNFVKSEKDKTED